MTKVLHGLSYSPWTERARWALDHHRIAYRYREHVPMLGELALRFYARGSGQERASVPLLRTRDAKIGDSWHIICWADAHGDGPSLCVERDDVVAWYAPIERGMEAVRARVTAAILADRAAQVESARAASPAFLAPMMAPLAAAGARHIVKKYTVDTAASSHGQQPLQHVLDRMQEALVTGPWLCGTAFTAADILGATLLQGIRPLASPRIPLLPATRQAWTDEALAERYASLLQWRDNTYASRR